MTAIAASALPVRNATTKSWSPSWGSFAWVSPVLLFALWWWAAEVEIFPREILVPPGAVVGAFVELWQSGELARHMGATFYRLWFGFGAGALAGLAFGTAAALSRTVEDYTASLFTVIRTVPTIAFIPILILIFGIDETFKILIVAKATFFPVALATLEGVRAIPRRYFDVAHAYRLPAPYFLRRVILPAALPSVVTGIRLGLGRSWGVLVAAELIVSDSGIGQMMEFGRQMFRLDVVMVGVVITGVIGFSLDRIVRFAEARLSRWKGA